MVKLKLINPTFPNVGEMADSKVEEENTSSPNKEVKLYDGDLKAKLIIGKAKVPRLASYAMGPTKSPSAYKRRHSMPSKQNLE